MKIISSRIKESRINDLIERCYMNGGHIVCAWNEVIRIAQKASVMGLDIPFPITYDEFLSSRYTILEDVKEIYIDDITRLLEYISKSPVVFAGFDGEIFDLDTQDKVVERDGLLK